MNKHANIKYYSPILKGEADSITAQERAIFDLNFSISERIYQILQEKKMTKRELARLTGKKDAEVSRWFMMGHNFTTKTIAIIQQALGVPLIQVTKD
ncbi:MAG: helix-turn-helix domain-containing protein [Paludibacteraceae bacterium]|nr:helix-turn-helix domain-containing protein [Paludibacteraceae bacterium]